MANLSSLRADVRVFANNCPDVTVDKYLVQAIRDFCKESWYYQQTLLVNQTASTATYTITPASSEEIIAIDIAKQGGSKLYPVDQHETSDTVWSSFTDWNTGRYQFEPPNSFTVFPIPTTTVSNNFELRLVV